MSSLFWNDKMRMNAFGTFNPPDDDEDADDDVDSQNEWEQKKSTKTLNRKDRWSILLLFFLSSL